MLQQLITIATPLQIFRNFDEQKNNVLARKLSGISFISLADLCPSNYKIHTTFFLVFIL